MDKVRFGRALGQGAREATKAAVKAVNAATAPDPNAARPNPARPNPVRPAATPSRSQIITPRPEATARTQAKAPNAGVREGGRRFKAAVVAPAAKAGAVLWLEVTGVVFGVFALAAATALWRNRMNFSVGGAAQRNAWLAAVMFALFFYFCVTSYIRAARRNRRP